MIYVRWLQFSRSCPSEAQVRAQVQAQVRAPSSVLVTAIPDTFPSRGKVERDCPDSKSELCGLFWA